MTIQQYNFDEKIDRNKVTTLKFDSKTMLQVFGSAELWPSWVADMDFKAATEIIESMKQRLNHGVFGYESGNDELSNAIVKWYQQRYGWNFTPSDIIFTPRTLNSLTVLVELFSKTGDGVIIQSPVFYDFKLIIKSTKRKLIKNPLIFHDGKYEFDFEDLEAKAANPDNKLLILCNPHNPIGRCWNADELKQLSDICYRHQVFIIADEIHGDLTYHKKYTPLASISEQAAANSATCISPVKSFNLAGVANSMIVMADNDKRSLCANWYNQKELNKNNIFTNAAMLAAYTDGENWLDQVIQYLQGNLDVLRTFLQQNIPGIKLIEPDGTFLVWLDCNELGLDIKQLERFFIDEALMAINPGHWFGREGAGFIRMNIACPRSVLIDALKQLEKAVLKLPTN
ncbi:MAG: pyridoxal phosphate-dependent aminotransferase [Gammaproteobacteria bacterium]|jgi:cystathionine beta-lyase|nr:pyridoxal phosphate-dependent aminotransferase [Gammaproteobacteria bacterium]MBT3725392.1 pyridoxal phosphate-dependent aminotransferase [Gammaproteobacteria bacterium]MBT4076372.1 pyridoxal phosphate-dependent aminotransferase [Gammaproteobacteria bacterium]MBT4195162.1 pyridoxal phosphate-dependent aminotransferase [Gammaproteobacteria bacterium]MBT4448270.1 pyridoxal phosphate-dependent aminotransferase [Gammaproteobacteria bacterium]